MNFKPTLPKTENGSSLTPITARLVLGILALVTLMTTAWALASPLMGVPDEPAHFVRAAGVVRGEPLGSPDAVSRYPEILVPTFIAESLQMGCFAGDSSKTADCQAPVTDDDQLVVSRTSAAQNSPLYYALVGWPSLFLNGAPALYAMRIVSAVLTSLLLTTMITALLAQSRTWWPVTASIVGITPMVLFLGGSLNPNAVEMAGTGALLALLTLMLRRPLSNRQLWLAGSLAVASAFALTSGRSIGMLWLAIAGVAALLSVPWARVVSLLRRPPVWFALVGIAGAAISCLAWLAYFGAATMQSDSVIEPRAPGITAILLLMFENTFDYWSGWIGQFGWLDYQAPAGVMIVWFGAIGAVLFTGFVLTRGRLRLALIVTATATLIVPLAVQGSFYNEIGMMWQGRYLLPLYMCVLVLAGLALDEAFPRSTTHTSRKVVVAGVGLLAIAHVATFTFVLRRYVVGTQSWIQMVQAPEWQPPLGWITLVIAFALVWAVTVVLVVRWTQTSREIWVNPASGAAFVSRS